MEYIELQDDGAYGKLADGRWVITPKGLAEWMDQEGGLEGLYYHSGVEPFIEAGCDPMAINNYATALQYMEAELERIGAVL